MLSVYDFVDLSRRGTWRSVCSITCYKKECWSQYAYNKQITSWLVRLSDFCSLVVMNYKLTRSCLARSFVIHHNSWIKIVRAHQPWSNLCEFNAHDTNFVYDSSRCYMAMWLYLKSASPGYHSLDNVAMCLGDTCYLLNRIHQDEHSMR